MRAKGMVDGDYELGGQPVKVLDGEARLLDGTLAGSVLKMNDAVKNAVTKVGLPFELVIKAVTENPAKNIGVFDKYGSIEVGKKANFTVLDDDYGVVATIVDGILVYSKDK
jgi:N-acetylglucosamine-6-phosphate deacetylase